MTNIFDEEKYKDAAQKCLEFMKRQLNVNNFQYGLSFGEEYSSGYQGDVIWGERTGLSKEEDQVFPKYISCDKYYDYKYVGQVFLIPMDMGAYFSDDQDSRYAGF